VSTYEVGGHVNTSEQAISMVRRRRRRHSAAFKADAVAACLQPGVSIAAVALSRGLNANLLRRWLVEAVRTGALPVRRESAPGGLSRQKQRHRVRARRQRRLVDRLAPGREDPPIRFVGAPGGGRTTAAGVERGGVLGDFKVGGGHNRGRLQVSRPQ
jgi:transposase-like protein